MPIKPAHILCIDDESEAHYINSVYLKKIFENLTDKYCNTADEGIQYLDENKGNFPNVILLDLNLPIKDGYDFLNDYEEKGYDQLYNTKIIVLTSSEKPEDILKVKSYKSDTFYMKKPMTMEKMIDIKEKYLS